MPGDNIVVEDNTVFERMVNDKFISPESGLKAAPEKSAPVEETTSVPRNAEETPSTKKEKDKKPKKKSRRHV